MIKLDWNAFEKNIYSQEIIISYLIVCELGENPLRLYKKIAHR